MRAACPGKVILMGDHAAVYGRPAVLATVDLQTRVKVSPSRAPGVVAELVDLGCGWKWGAAEIVERTRSTRHRWQEYAADPTPKRLEKLLGEGDAERLAMLAIGEAARAAGRSPEGIRIRVSSELPMGAGLGSSASVAAAIAGGLLAFWEQGAAGLQVASVVREVERRQHGFPSGVDHQTVIRGGFVWAEPSPESGSVELTDLACTAAPQPILIDTGAPGQTTGEVVESVRQKVANGDVWDEMQTATLAFRRALESADDPRPAVRRYHRCLLRLGVVPDRVADWVRSWEDGGGAAKTSGAGATRGDRAGCLLAYAPANGDVERLSLLDGWTRLEVRIGTPGLTVKAE